MIYIYEVAQDFAHRKHLTNADDKKKKIVTMMRFITPPSPPEKINSCLSVVLAQEQNVA